MFDNKYKKLEKRVKELEEQLNKIILQADSKDNKNELIDISKTSDEMKLESIIDEAYDFYLNKYTTLEVRIFNSSIDIHIIKNSISEKLTIGSYPLNKPDKVNISRKHINKLKEIIFDDSVEKSILTEYSRYSCFPLYKTKAGYQKYQEEQRQKCDRLLSNYLFYCFDCDSNDPEILFDYVKRNDINFLSNYSQEQIKILDDYKEFKKYLLKTKPE